MHTFIHLVIYSSIHSSHTSKNCICICCITTLRVASRSGSRLIRYERRPTGVRRPVRKGLKATSRQTELGEKTQMSPSGPRLIRSEADRVILTFSFDPNLEPCPQNLHRGEASGPPKSVSGMTWASTGRRVKEKWNADDPNLSNSYVSIALLFLITCTSADQSTFIGYPSEDCR